MLSGAVWIFTWGDLIIFVTMVVLFAELVKATYTSTISLVDHGLSMLVFVACLVEFLVVGNAATSVFFFIMVARADRCRCRFHHRHSRCPPRPDDRRGTLSAKMR